MPRPSDHALAVARPVILCLTALNFAYAAVLVGLFVFSFFIEGWPTRPLGDFASLHPQIGNGLRAIVAIGVVGAFIVHTILARLRAMVDSVQAGDPFILDNARRLEAIAWSVLALEVLRLGVMAIAAIVWEPGRLGGLSLAPWLAVLLLFVLSGVFAHGARLRADLEGTV